MAGQKNTSKKSKTLHAKVSQKRSTKKNHKPAVLSKASDITNAIYKKTTKRIKGLQSRRPHRTFRHTKRRDYKRGLELPSYLEFTRQVTNVIWRNRKTLLSLAFTYALAISLVGGVINQPAYNDLQQVVQQTGEKVFAGDWNSVTESGALFLGAVGGSFDTRSLDVQQQSYLAIFGLLTWLTTVWLLRAILAGKKPRMRDGLYNAGAPIVSTALVSLLLIVQLLPIGILALIYGVLSVGGFLTGFGAMLFQVLAVLIIALVLYWVTSTFFALISCTVPGVYPMQAIRVGGDLVIGRRVRILLRILWMLFIVAIVWSIILIPLIIFDVWLKNMIENIAWLPIVPLVMSLMMALSVVWIASYVYILYRKVVEDDAKPAI